MSIQKYWHETLHNHSGQYFSVDNVIYHEKTNYHDLIIFDNARFGRIMALDGVVQTTENDEFIYHEMMTHIPLLAHGDAKKVLIIGGGDGAMLREVSKHKNLESITMVEIDSDVISLCKQHLPNHHAGSFDDARLNLVIDDGINFVNHTNQFFDVIISDCTDPIGAGKNLFTSIFYEGCKRILNPNGIFVAQNGVYFLQQEEVIDSHRKLNRYFKDVSFYQAAIPSYYGGCMTFAWATDNKSLRDISYEMISKRFTSSGLKCQHYNPEIHSAAFALPQYLKDALISIYRK